MTPALLLVWIPAGIGLLGVSWSATTFTSHSGWIAGGTAAVQVVAVLTLILGPLGAILHDDIAEVAIYSIVGDAGFILLAMSARDADAAAPARMWLLVFVGAKTALLAWAEATTWAFGSPGLARLHGWLRRAPILGLALVAIGAASLGWPGSAVYEARTTLVDLALPGWLHLVGPAALALSIVYYVRLLYVGVLAPSETVMSSQGEFPRRSRAMPDVPIEGPAVTAVTAVAESISDGGVATVPSGGLAAAAPGPHQAVAPGAEAGPARTGRGRKTTRPAQAAEPLPVATAEAEPLATAEAAPAAPRVTGARLLGAHRSLANRTLATSAAVLAAAALALTLAVGGLGSLKAAQNGIPLDEAARATPTPTPTPVAPMPTPLPTLAPHATLNPSAVVGASISPDASAAPTHSSAPATVPAR
jgi:NADH:ubiquinone oxidoreductase subunit 5 (subunit L)/multisubunit Na+/H+ antiporter MnhA subunit